MNARGFELPQIVEAEPSVPGPAGEHHGPSLYALADLQAQSEWTAIVARETRRLVGDRHLGSKFLRLIVGTRHQGHAADSRGETEIVLDPRGRASLAAERAAIEHNDRKAL